jgi:hypothetical protein
MGVPSRYSGKAISNQPVKNANSTLLNAGNVNPLLANNLSLSESAGNQNMYGSQMVVSVSPTSSGNVGIGKAISNGTFNVNQDGNYIAIMLGTKIAGVATSQLRNSAGSTPRSSIIRYQGYRRYDNQSWDAKTGILTKGPNAGAAVLPSGIDGRVGAGADDAQLYPGELTTYPNGIRPITDEYNG